MKEVSREEMDIRARTTDSGGAGAFGGESGGGGDLNAAVQALPRLMERKGVLEQHTNILQATMKQVASRSYPTFNEHEEGIITRQHVNLPALRELLQSTGCVFARALYQFVCCFSRSLSYLRSLPPPSMH